MIKSFLYESVPANFLPLFLSRFVFYYLTFCLTPIPRKSGTYGWPVSADRTKRRHSENSRGCCVEIVKTHGENRGCVKWSFIGGSSHICSHSQSDMCSE